MTTIIVFVFFAQIVPLSLTFMHAFKMHPTEPAQSINKSLSTVCIAVKIILHMNEKTHSITK